MKHATGYWQTSLRCSTLSTVQAILWSTLTPSLTFLVKDEALLNSIVDLVTCGMKKVMGQLFVMYTF